MLRNKILKHITEILNSPPTIIPEDFNVSSKKNSPGVDIRIDYLCGNSEYIKAYIPVNKTRSSDYYDFTIDIECSPGEITNFEKITVRGLSAYLEQINMWSKRVAEDIQNGPIFRSVEEHKIFIQQIEEKIELLPDDYATEEQAKKLRDWIVQIETELKEEIKKLHLKEKEKESKIKEIEEQLAILSSRVESTKVKNLFRVALNRIYKIVNDNRTYKFLDAGKKIVGLISGNNDSETS